MYEIQPNNIRQFGAKDKNPGVFARVQCAGLVTSGGKSADCNRKNNSGTEQVPTLSRSCWQQT